MDRFEELISGLIFANLFQQFNGEERVIPDRIVKVKMLSVMLIDLWLKGNIINNIMF